MLDAAAVKDRALELGFALCGVAPATDHPELQFLPGWLAAGYAGNMAYLPRTARRRADVRRILPSAKTVISLGTVYNTNRPYSVEVDDASVADISRYAWGSDYHDVVGTRTDALFEWMQTASDQPFEGRVYVDTGPVQERVYAQYAGLGWIGKNTCVINPELGSWLFLSEILCSLPLDTDMPSLDQCGTCSLCLDACPTGAIVEPWVLDATRCLSYLTIEVKQSIPLAQRESLSTHIYGCDICQDVCPWNAHAATSDDVAWQPHAAFDRPPLAELWGQTDAFLSPIVTRSAMSHTGLRNIRRNIAVAMGNSGTAESKRALETQSTHLAMGDAVVTEHVAWARRQLDASSRST